MKTVKNFFEMAGRLVAFARTHADIFAQDKPLAQAMSELEAAVQRYLELASALRGGDAAVRASSTGRSRVRAELREAMEHVSSVAKSLELDQFTMPRENSDAVVLSVGRMWIENTLLRRKFEEQGLTHLLDELKTVAGKMSTVLDEHSSSKGLRTEAVHAIQQTQKLAGVALKRVDPLIRRALRDQRPVLAAWEQARRVARVAAAKPAIKLVKAGDPEASPPDGAAVVVT
jgi:hypothetical protein